MVLQEGLRPSRQLLSISTRRSLLANKGRSTSERSRYIEIRYFFVTHHIEEQEIELRYLPTVEMVADLHTKPLHGTMFENMAGCILGRPGEYN